VTPLTIEFARACCEINTRLDPNIFEVLEDKFQTMVNVWKHRNLQTEYEERVNKGLAPRGKPNDDAIKLFQSKALEIFQSLPVGDTLVHVEFREAPRLPFPVVV
jgi:hypothetical protein